MTSTWEYKISNAWVEVPSESLQVGDRVMIDHYDNRLKHELSDTPDGIERMNGIVTQISANWVSVCINRSMKAEDCCRHADIICCLKYQEPDFDLGL